MRRRIIPGRVYSAHPILEEARRKSEKNRMVVNPQKKPMEGDSNHKEDVEFSDQFLYEKWKKNHL